MSCQPESRTRENRTSGSEGGVAQTNAPSLPLSMRLRNAFKNVRRAGGRRSDRPRTIAHATIIDLDGSPPAIALRPFRRGQRPDAKRSAGLRHGVVASHMKSPSGHS